MFWDCTFFYVSVAIKCLRYVDLLYVLFEFSSFKSFKIYLKQREKEGAGGEVEGEGERESQVDSMLSAEPGVGLDLTTEIMT